MGTSTRTMIGLIDRAGEQLLMVILKETERMPRFEALRPKLAELHERTDDIAASATQGLGVETRFTSKPEYKSHCKTPDCSTTPTFIWVKWMLALSRRLSAAVSGKSGSVCAAVGGFSTHPPLFFHALTRARERFTAVLLYTLHKVLYILLYQARNTMLLS